MISVGVPPHLGPQPFGFLLNLSWLKTLGWCLIGPMSTSPCWGSCMMRKPWELRVLWGLSRSSISYIFSFIVRERGRRRAWGLVFKGWAFLMALYILYWAREEPLYSHHKIIVEIARSCPVVFPSIGGFPRNSCVLCVVLWIVLYFSFSFHFISLLFSIGVTQKVKV